MKFIITWIFVILISIALIFSVSLDSFFHKKNDYLIINKQKIDNNAFNSFIDILLNSYKNLNNQDKENISQILKKNINLNLEIKNINILCSKIEIIHRILSNDLFQNNNGLFSYKKYEDYLNNLNIDEVNFEKNLKKFSTNFQLKLAISDKFNIQCKKIFILNSNIETNSNFILLSKFILLQTYNIKNIINSFNFDNKSLKNFYKNKLTNYSKKKINLVNYKKNLHYQNVVISATEFNKNLTKKIFYNKFYYKNLYLRKKTDNIKIFISNNIYNYKNTKLYKNDILNCYKRYNSKLLKHANIKNKKYILFLKSDTPNKIYKKLNENYKILHKNILKKNKKLLNKIFYKNLYFKKKKYSLNIDSSIYKKKNLILLNKNNKLLFKYKKKIYIVFNNT
jgi:hypothetical protein